MKKEHKQLLMLAGAGALAYYFFVYKKKPSTSVDSSVIEPAPALDATAPSADAESGFSNVGGYYSSQEFCLDHYGQGNNHGVSYEMCRAGHHEPDGRGIRGGVRKPQARRRR